MQVLIDNSFIEKFKYNNYGGLDDMFIFLKILNMEPMIIKYILDNELLFNAPKYKLENKKINVIDLKNVFNTDEKIKRFKENFIDLYNGLCDKCELIGKAVGRINIEDEKDIFNIYHKQGSSVGDVYMALLAHEIKIPIILTNDSDFYTLESFFNEMLSIGNDMITLIDADKLVEMVRESNDKTFTPKQLKLIRRCIKSNNKV